MNNLVLLGVCNTCNNHFFSFCAKNRRLILLTLDLNGASQVAVIVMNPPASAGDARDPGSVPGSGRSPRVGDSNPLHYSHLENSTDR